MAERDLNEATQPQESVGIRLRLAREAQGLSRADIAARTKIAERHLAAIEEDRYADLASGTYAVGFSRAYARTVGLDEREIGAAVRASLNAGEDNQVRQPVTFEPGDPARVPGSRVAWIAGLGVLVMIAAIFFGWRSYTSPAVTLPDLVDDNAAAANAQASVAAPSAAALVAAPVGEQQVVLTATQDRVWMKLTDATGAQLFQKEMALGESYTVPAGTNGPKVDTARPDALRVTVGGKDVPRLADRQMVIRGVPVSAAALLGRATPSRAAPAASPSVRSPVAAVGRPGPRAATPAQDAAAAIPAQAGAEAPVVAAAPQAQASTVSQ